jgi:hypothetical protein
MHGTHADTSTVENKAHIMSFQLLNVQHNDTQHNDIQHNDTQHKELLCDTQYKRQSALTTLSITILCYYAECRILFAIMLNVIMLNVIMLIVVAPTAMLDVQCLTVTNTLAYCSTGLLYKTVYSNRLS